MIKQLFALASVTALGGLVAAVSAAGCSTSPKDDTGQAEPAKNIDATEKKDAATTPPSTAGGDAAAGVACKAKISYTAEEIHPPAAQQQVCTADEVNALADACAKDPNAQECTDARNGAGNKECASCIFGAKDDAEWKVINLQPGETPGARYNQEGCVDHTTGVKGCGHAYVTVLGCFNDFCARCAQDQQKLCVEEVAEGECKDFRITDQKCGTALGDDEMAVDSCFPKTPDLAGVKGLFTYMARIACGPPPAQKDGG
jgi:hypothetical protein